MSKKVNELITERMIELMQNGQVPWLCSWDKTRTEQFNLISKKSYKGINQIILGSMGYRSQYWASFNQIQSAGGKVRKGEKGLPVIFWSLFEKNIDDEVKSFPFLKYSTVFNLDQTDGIQEIPPSPEVEIVEAHQIVQSMLNPPEIKHIGFKPCYTVESDLVEMPIKERFINIEEYYSTLFHELVHSTGHNSRLNRFDGEKVDYNFGSETYSFEELVAELGASFLCGKAQILSKVERNSAAYLKGWISRLSENPDWIIKAASRAQKASDYILGTTND